MTNPSTTLILAVVQPEDAPALLGALAEIGRGATYLTARGGFLNRHAVAVLVLTPTIGISGVLRAIQSTCSRRMALVTPVTEAEFGYIPEPLEVEIGGAVIFGLPVTSETQWGAVPTPARRQSALVGAGRSVAPGVIMASPVTTEEVPMPDTSPAQLIIAVVPDRVASRVTAALVDHHIGATSIGSTGGFLRRGNTTILSGVPADQAAATAQLIQDACHAAGETEAGEGGIAFALDVAWRLRL